jgi:hypothetical protein
MLEPTQNRLNGSGPERSLSNGAGLGSEWGTVPRGPRMPVSASAGNGGQFPGLRGNRSERGTDHPPCCPDRALPTTRAGRAPVEEKENRSCRTPKTLLRKTFFLRNCLR